MPVREHRHFPLLGRKSFRVRRVQPVHWGSSAWHEACNEYSCTASAIPDSNVPFQEVPMRKIAPAFILTTLVAFSSGSAFALGDANKNKKAPTVTPAASDATAPADKTYTAPTNPSISGAGTASDTGKGGATPTGSPPGATSSTTSSNASMANDTVAVGKSKPYSAKDCQGLAVTDP